MCDETYEKVKALLFDNEQLFAKLYRVGEAYGEIDFDESGFYEEEEATVLRHWGKLAAKLAKALDTGLPGCSVSLPKHYTPDRFRISVEIKPQEEEPGLLDIDYSVAGQIIIERKDEA